MDNPDRHFATSFGTYLGVSCLLVGLGALGMSYWLGGPAWTVKYAKFGQPDAFELGFWNEAVRLFLVVCLAFATLCTGFGRELYWLFSPSGAIAGTSEDSSELSEKSRQLWINLFRVTIAVTVVIMTARKTHQSLDLSKEGLPATLVSWGLQPAPPELNREHLAYESDQTGDFRHMLLESRRAYLFYLPYSLVNFAIIFPLLLLVPLFAVVTTEWFLLGPASRDMCKFTTVKNAKDRMVGFRYECYHGAMRYLNLFAAIALFFVYVQFDRGITEAVRSELQTVFYLLTFASGVFFVRIWTVYHNFWQEMSYYVLMQDESQQDFVDKNSPFQFFQSMFRQPLPGFAIAGLAATMLRAYFPFDLPV